MRFGLKYETCFLQTSKIVTRREENIKMGLFGALFGTSTKKDEQAQFVERWNAGVKAFDQDDGATAARIMRPFAEQGIADAQYMMAVLLAKGHGIRTNMEESGQWALKAAMQKHAGAFFLVGLASMCNDPKNSYMMFYACSLLSSKQGVSPEKLREFLTATGGRLNQQEIANAQAAAKAFLRT